MRQILLRSWILVGLLSFALLTPLQGRAAVAIVGSPVTGKGDLSITGVTSGNLLVYVRSIFRLSSTGAAVPTPTDSNGTWAVANADAVATLNGAAFDIGVGIFYCQNANAGTHNLTVGAITDDNGTLMEFSGISATALDQHTSAKTNGDSTYGSQVTGTTGTLAQADELVIIGLALGAVAGANPQPGWTNPVSGFTTVQSVSNTLSDTGTLHAYKIVSATTAQSATFAWTAGVDQYASQGNIATFKAIAAAGPDTTPFYKRRIQ